ncbi:unnamed protein product, partial [Closterium sp. Naga37s-1]
MAHCVVPHPSCALHPAPPAAAGRTRARALHPAPPAAFGPTHGGWVAHLGAVRRVCWAAASPLLTCAPWSLSLPLLSPPRLPRSPPSPIS